MHQTMRRSRRMIFAASAVLAGFGTASCGSTPQQEQSATVPVTPTDDTTTTEADTTTTDATTDPVVLSAADGLAARNEAPNRSGAGDARLASSSVLAADTLMVDSIDGCGVYEPSAEEIAAANVDSEALAATLDRYGIAYERTTDDFGFVQIAFEPFDVVAESVSQSFWAARYPVEPISEEELAAQAAQNDIIATQLDNAGVLYSRTIDEQGYESIEYDYDDPAAQSAVDAAWLIISPPQPPDAETLAIITEENEALVAAFDAAGVDYQRFADELGWQWLEWDYENQAINDIVTSVYGQLYPPITIDPIAECALVDVMIDDVMAVDDAAVEVTSELSADDIARRDAEVVALAEGFTASGVTFEVQGESPWQLVTFDLTNDAGIPVVQAIVAARS